MAAPFAQITMNLFERIAKNTTSSEGKLFYFMAGKILKSIKGRINLMGEFSCRYLSKFFSLSYGYVAEILRRLCEKGFLKLIKRGKSGYGSIYKLILSPEELVTFEKANNNPCEVERTKNNNLSFNDIHDLSDKNFRKAMNIAKAILRKKNINEPETILNRITSFINTQAGKILNPAGYLVGACKREPEVKPEPRHYLTAEETKRNLDYSQKQDPIVPRAEEMPEVKPEELDTLPGQGRNYLEELDMIRASYPDRVKEIEKILHREEGIRWNFILDIMKAEMIVERFVEQNS